jgi:hypothetical protein
MASFPCCLFDNCPGDKVKSEQVAQDEHHSGDQDGCGSCSPFCACSTCFIAIDQFSPFHYTWKALVPFIRVDKFLLYEPQFTSSFFHSFWQPPKIG